MTDEMMAETSAAAAADDTAAGPRFLDLSLGSVARVGYFSVFGLHVFVAALALAFYAVAFFTDPGQDVANMWPVPVGMVAMVVMAPFAWAGLLALGFLLQRRLRPAPDEALMCFSGGGTDYPALDSDSLYRLLTFASRGVVNIAALFWGLDMLRELIGYLVWRQGLDAMYVGGKLVLVALTLLIGPYVWGWLFMMGGHIGRPVARRLGLGALRFRAVA